MSLRVGWWALAIFVTLGVALETLHATKAGFYLDEGNETRRLMWRLAHAHGTLIAVLNIVYGLCIRSDVVSSSPLASRSLLAALVLLPLGFFLGGIGMKGGDPSIGAAFVPAGALALILGIVQVARVAR